MSTSPLVAALAALFLWWFSTGSILLVVRRCDRAGRQALVSATLFGLIFVVLGFAGLQASRMDTSVTGLYIAFASALALWGWIELAFLSGVITGPVRSPQPDGLTPRDRFRAGFGVVAWHEGLLLAVFLWLFLDAQTAANPLAAVVFGVLYVARIFAKLNLFMGVPGINLEAVPSTLSHVPSYFRISPPSWMFPLSITVLSMMLAIWIERLGSAPTPESAVTFALLSALTALALLEHWMMLIPLADTKLWRWLDRSTEPRSTTPHGAPN